MMRVPIKEEEFSKLEVEVGEVWTKGRNVYGFFVSEEDFQEIAEEEFLSDGHLGPLNCEVDAICLMTSASFSNFSKEDLEKAERGEFIVGNKPDTIKKIEKYNLPVIEIKIWHKFKDFFRT